MASVIKVRDFTRKLDFSNGDNNVGQTATAYAQTLEGMAPGKILHRRWGILEHGLKTLGQNPLRFETSSSPRQG